MRKQRITLIKGELACVEGSYIRHDPDKTAKLIIELICTDLKFKDKHSDEQYMLLNSKLKEENNKIEKSKKKVKKVKEKNVKQKEKGKRASKFSNKYKDRIESIKESEKTRQENIRIQEKARELIEEEEQKEKEKFLKETYSKKAKK